MKSAYIAKDEVMSEKSKVQEQLAVCQVEKAAIEEQMQRTERRLQDENSALQASVVQGHERAKELQAQLEKLQAEKGTLDAQMAVSNSEKRGTDEAQRRTEQLLARFQQDHPALTARCDAAEDQNKELRLQRDSMNEEMAQLKREMAALVAEKSGLAELARKGEEEQGRSEQQRSSLTERCENAEARVKELQHSKDAAFAEKSRALQQLAVLTSEKNAADESGTRLQIQLREERGALTTRCEAAEAACREVTRDRDAMAEEKSRMGEQLAVASVQMREGEARVRELERTLQLTQEERGALNVKCEALEGRLKDGDAMKDSVTSERQRLEQEMAVAASERRRVDEACARAEAHIKELQKDKQSLGARAEAAEGRVKDVLAMRDAVVEERSRALETLAAAQAEKTGLEETVRRCELQIRTLTDDKASLLARADAAEERGKELTRQRDAAHGERSKLTEQLGVSHTERRAVEEVLRLTEVRIGEERPALMQRCEFAEKRCNEMEGQRDALAKERQQLLDTLTAEKDGHAETQRELASSAAERRALEELLHRTEARLGDERAALRASADGAEARGAEVARQRDQAIEERIRGAEAQSASEADRRSAEDATLRLTAELKRLGEERTATLERLGATDERNRELSMQLESAQNALAEGQEQRSSLQREKTALSQNLAVTQTELRGKEVVARHSETRLHEEKLALQARCEAAEERCHEINARRDALQSDRARLQDSYNSLLDERNRMEVRRPERACSQSSRGSSPRPRLGDLPHQDAGRHPSRLPLILSRSRPPTPTSTLLSALQERFGQMQSENRGLQELALYVNAITRSGGGQGKSAGTAGGDGMPQGVLPPASDIGSSAHASMYGGGGAALPTGYGGGGGGTFGGGGSGYGSCGGGGYGSHGSSASFNGNDRGGPPPSSFNGGAPHGTSALHAASSALNAALPPSAGSLPTRSFSREGGSPPTSYRSTGHGRSSNSTPPGAPRGPASVSWAAEDVQVSSAIAAARELSAQRASASSTLELLDPRDAAR